MIDIVGVADEDTVGLLDGVRDGLDEFELLTGTIKNKSVPVDGVFAEKKSSLLKTIKKFGLLPPLGLISFTSDVPAEVPSVDQSSALLPLLAGKISLLSMTTIFEDDVYPGRPSDCPAQKSFIIDVPDKVPSDDHNSTPTEPSSAQKNSLLLKTSK